MREKLRTFWAGKACNVLFSLLAVLVMWAAWLVAYAAVGNDYVLPSFWATLRGLGELLTEGFFWRSFALTLLRAAEGWLLAYACAVAGVALGALSGKCRSFLAPFVAVLRTVPTLAVTLMLVLWFSKHTVPVIVTFLMLFPVSYAQLSAAYRAIDPKLLDMAKVYRLSRFDRIFRIAVPQMLPSLFAQAGPNFSLSVKVAVSAEILAHTYNALGWMMQDAGSYPDPVSVARMFALTLVVLVTGGLVEFALGQLTRITDVWKTGRGHKKPREARR